MTNFFFDPRVTDPDLLADMNLAADVVREASEADEMLSTEQIDRLLGVRPEPRGDA